LSTKFASAKAGSFRASGKAPELLLDAVSMYSVVRMLHCWLRASVPSMVNSVVVGWRKGFDVGVQVNGNVAHPQDNEWFEVMEEIAVGGHANDHLEGNQM
jgi:hypothetical protein